MSLLAKEKRTDFTIVSIWVYARRITFGRGFHKKVTNDSVVMLDYDISTLGIIGLISSHCVVSVCPYATPYAC